MEIYDLLKSKTIKTIEKRNMIIELILENSINIDEVALLSEKIDEKQVGILLEAMEAVSAKRNDLVNLKWLEFSQKYIDSKSNSLKREASRIVGNIAHLFPDKLDNAIKLILENTKHESTVVRWSAAYALARIIAIPQFAKNELFDKVLKLSETETENGVKNQYLGGIKKANKLRK